MRFDTRMQFGEDHVFILDYVRLVDRIALLDRALYYYVDNAGSLVHQGLNPVGVVKMKWNTYLPYLRLYRDLALFERFYERPSTSSSSCRRRMPLPRRTPSPSIRRRCRLASRLTNMMRNLLRANFSFRH